MNSLQADGRFLRGILAALIFATLLAGTVAGVAMVRSEALQAAGASTSQR